MKTSWHVLVSLITLWLGMPLIPAHAQVVLQSRIANIGPGTCNGQDTVSTINLTGSSALPAAANTFVVGADIVIQTPQSPPTAGVQHVFVGVDSGSLVGAGPPGNGLLVTLAAGEVHSRNIFPFNSNFVGEVAGFKLNNTTPSFAVTYSCTGQFQGQVIFYFIQF